ncbi:MAG: hypothetical protein RMJ35_14105, partial [Phycisphaerales bacterium]|nr:hypothetical protein [Phycisphaerales bacterium]
FKGNEGAAQLAESLRLTSGHLKRLNIIDAIIQEPLGGAHRDPHSAAHNLEQFIVKTLRELRKIRIDDLIQRRYEKFRTMGQFEETSRQKLRLASA